MKSKTKNTKAEVKPAVKANVTQKSDNCPRYIRGDTYLFDPCPNDRRPFVYR